MKKVTVCDVVIFCLDGEIHRRDQVYLLEHHLDSKVVLTFLGGAIETWNFKELQRYKASKVYEIEV